MAGRPSRAETTGVSPERAHDAPNDFSPDGETIYLTNDEGGRYRILAKRADGSGEEQILHDSTTPVWLDGASPK